MNLYESLAGKVAGWRQQKYPCAEYPAIGEILDFISPAILERLRQPAGSLALQIEDWRAMVDSVMLDPAYDGQVFNLVLADIPERKSDLVQGGYHLPTPEGATSVAVKITDMLGEEVLAVGLLGSRTERSPRESRL